MSSRSKKHAGGHAAMTSSPAPQPLNRLSEPVGPPAQSAGRSRRARRPVRRIARYYNVLRFETPLNGVAACRQIADVLTAEHGAKGTSRGSTLWLAPSGLDDGSCHVYACDVALDVARALEIDAPVVAYADDTQLPHSSCLFLGDQSGQSGTERRLHSANLLALCMESFERQNMERTRVDPPTGVPAPERTEVF